MKKKITFSCLGLALLTGAGFSAHSTITPPSSIVAVPGLSTLEEMKTYVSGVISAISEELYRQEEANLLAAAKTISLSKLESATSKSQCEAILSSFRRYVGSLKTKAAYEAEEAERMLVIKEEKRQKLQRFNPQAYRQEEKGSIAAEKTRLINQLDGLATLKEVEEFDETALATFASTKKSNAAYTFEEMATFATRSGEASAWTFSNGVFSSNSKTGLLLDSGHRYGDMTFTFKGGKTSDAGDFRTFGFFYGTQTAEKGYSGYWLTLMDTGSSRIFQIRRWTNYMGASGEKSDQFLHDWNYASFGEIKNQEFRFVKSGNTISLYNEVSYQSQGTQGIGVTWDLSTDDNGTAYDIYNQGYLGLFAGRACDFTWTLTSLLGNEDISGVAVAKVHLENYVASLTISSYPEEKQNRINAEIERIRNLSSYNGILEGIQNLKRIVSE